MKILPGIKFIFLVLAITNYICNWIYLTNYKHALFQWDSKYVPSLSELKFDTLHLEKLNILFRFE